MRRSSRRVLSSAVEHFLHTEGATGSIPVAPTKSAPTSLPDGSRLRAVRVLHDACRILGGEHKLAEYLGVSVVLVAFWLDGRGQPPDSVLLRCSDLLHEQR